MYIIVLHMEPAGIHLRVFMRLFEAQGAEASGFYGPLQRWGTWLDGISESNSTVLVLNGQV